MIKILPSCDGCGLCVGVCPDSALSLPGVRAVLSTDSCSSCGICVDLCPVAAIKGERVALCHKQ